MPLLLPLVGVHGSGKTALGEALQQRGVAFEREIGTTLRAASADPVNADQDAFDRVVYLAECERDASRPQDSVVAVESWHLGNLAFARARRSWDVVARYEAERPWIRAEAIVNPIRIHLSAASFLVRNSERGIGPSASLLFYRRVATELDAILKQHFGESVIHIREPWDVGATAERLVAQMATWQ